MSIDDGNENNPESPDSEDEEEFDWHVEQHPFHEEEVSLDAPKYGFANQRSGVFLKLQVKGQNIFYLYFMYLQSQELICYLL